MDNKLNNTDDWYFSWFDTSYYHLLYRNRNEAEAEFFLNNLISKLTLSDGSKVWDMACGKGRHAFNLSKLGMNVLGTDLSENSIKLAKAKYSHSNLDFFVHDMRGVFRTNYFDCVLNVFTSLGYFNNTSDDERVFFSASQSLTKDGVFVVDFMNVNKVISNLVPKELKVIDDIHFEINRELIDGVIIKKIKVVDGEKEFKFIEKVRAYYYDELIAIARLKGFQLKDIYGNYNLEDFNESDSDRAILIFNKK